MSRSQPTVTVYSFQILDEGPERARHAPFKAPRQDIVSRYNALILEGTAQEVEESELDEERRYRRVPTGWGDL
jgi:hypothetical protein